MTTWIDKIKAEGSEMRCQRCPNRNVKSWFVVREIWNVVRPDGSGILCPQCFTELHAEATGDWQTWEISPARGRNSMLTGLFWITADSDNLWTCGVCGALVWMDGEGVDIHRKWHQTLTPSTR